VRANLYREGSYVVLHNSVKRCHYRFRVTKNDELLMPEPPRGWQSSTGLAWAVAGLMATVVLAAAFSIFVFAQQRARSMQEAAAREHTGRELAYKRALLGLLGRADRGGRVSDGEGSEEDASSSGSEPSPAGARGAAAMEGGDGASSGGGGSNEGSMHGGGLARGLSGKPRISWQAPVVPPLALERLHSPPQPGSGARRGSDGGGVGGGDGPKAGSGEGDGLKQPLLG